MNRGTIRTVLAAVIPIVVELVVVVVRELDRPKPHGKRFPRGKRRRKNRKTLKTYR